MRRKPHTVSEHWNCEIVDVVGDTIRPSLQHGSTSGGASKVHRCTR
jgi:hypothetical protein